MYNQNYCGRLNNVYVLLFIFMGVGRCVQFFFQFKIRLIEAVLSLVYNFLNVCFLMNKTAFSHRVIFFLIKIINLGSNIRSKICFSLQTYLILTQVSVKLVVYMFYFVDVFAVSSFFVCWHGVVICSSNYEIEYLFVSSSISFS